MIIFERTWSIPGLFVAWVFLKERCLSLLLLHRAYRPSVALICFTGVTPVRFTWALGFLHPAAFGFRLGIPLAVVQVLLLVVSSSSSEDTPYFSSDRYSVTYHFTGFTLNLWPLFSGSLS